MVNIIIPAYNAHQTIHKTLASILMQDCLDEIIITIVDDCSNEPYDYLLKDFSYLDNLRIIRKKSNTGCGQSRQFGIDNCDCEYFMFLDADDCLYCPSAVRELLRTIKESDYDYVISDFVEELSDETYVLIQKSGVWMHGKIFKTKFIVENNIRFNNTRLNEDHAFNSLVLYSNGKGKYINYITYVWKYNKMSLVRRPDQEEFSIDEFIKNACYTITEFINRKYKEESIIEKYVDFTITFYGYYNKYLEYKFPVDFVNRYLNSLMKFYANFPSQYKKLISDEIVKNRYYKNDVVQELIRERIICKCSWDDFIMHFSDIDKN